METLKFDTLDQQQYLPRGKLEELCAQASPDQNKSPRMTKKSNPRNQQKQPQEPAFDMRKLPPSPVNDMGVTEKTQQFLEVSFSNVRATHPKLTIPHSCASLFR